MSDLNRKKALEDLINDVKSGDEDAGRKIVKFFEPAIKGKCNKFNINNYDFEDLYSECISVLFKCIYRYEEGSNCFYTYVCNAFDNELKYLLRKSHSEEKKSRMLMEKTEVFYDLEEVEDGIWKEQVLNLAQDFFKELSEDDKNMIDLLYIKGYSMTTVSKDNGLPFHKVQYLRNNLVRRLRKVFIEAEAI